MAEYTTASQLDETPLPLDGTENLYVEPLILGERKGRRCTTNDIIYHPVLTVRDRGYVSGFDIYKVGNQEICIRPGVRYYTNGTLETVIEKTDFQSIDSTVINALTASKWYGVFLNYDGVVAIDATPLTGAASVRPSDSFYGWVDGDNTKYRHDRQGYYNGDYLCIGCIYLDGSKYVTYIINQLSGSDEIGENSLGTWGRRGKIQTVTRQAAGSLACATAQGSIYRSASAINGGNWPVELLSIDTFTANCEGYFDWIVPDTTWTVTGATPGSWFLQNGSSAASHQYILRFSAEGHWHV